MLFINRGRVPTFNYAKHMFSKCYSRPISGSSMQNSSLNEDNTTSEDAENKQEDSKSNSDQDYDVKHIRKQVLTSALPFVHDLGWSTEAISNGAETLGYSSMVHGMFSGGGVELVNFFNEKCNNELELHLKTLVEEDKNKNSSTTNFIENAIKYRLLLNGEYISNWPQAMALNAAPTNTTNALHNIGTLVDHIWYYAGDRSNDFNWYTKRGVVALVYKSTELCMVQDQSVEFKDTWEFLERRLKDVHAAASILKDANNYSKDISTFTSAGIQTALNILGMNKKSR